VQHGMTREGRRRVRALNLRWRCFAVGILLFPANAAWAHAFPDHSEPRVGHAVDAPHAVRVWFDGELEPVFSTIRVEDGNRRRVDSGDARVNPADNKLLEVSLPALPPGRYRVVWSVVARDGHRTEGSFPFQIK
jgi:copper resistance protein C